MDGPCLNSQFDLCYAPCSGEFSKEEYDYIISKSVIRLFKIFGIEDDNK